ncbi:MAG TPA: hypothetical protein VIF10_02715 [Methylobacter sp.]|jgi:hypothetical protein
MSKLVEILREAERTDLGSDGQGNPLLEKLDAHRKTLLYTFLALFVVLAALIGLGAFGMWHLLFNGSTEQINAWSGAVGLAGSTSLVEILRRVWTEWAQTSLVVLLVTDAPEPLVNAVVQKLLDKLG